MDISLAVVHTSSLIPVFLIYVTYLIPASIGLCKSCFTCDMLLFSHPAVSDSLRPHGLQQARLSCPHHLLELAQTHVH